MAITPNKNDNNISRNKNYSTIKNKQKNYIPPHILNEFENSLNSSFNKIRQKNSRKLNNLINS